jgi:hypothetical protein
MWLMDLLGNVLLVVGVASVGMLFWMLIFVGPVVVGVMAARIGTHGGKSAIAVDVIGGRFAAALVAAGILGSDGVGIALAGERATWRKLSP